MGSYEKRWFNPWKFGKIEKTKMGSYEDAYKKFRDGVRAGGGAIKSKPEFIKDLKEARLVLSKEDGENVNSEIESIAREYETGQIKRQKDIKDAIKRPEASNSKKLPKNQLNLKDSYPKSLLLDVETERNVSTELSTVKDIKVIKTGKQQVEFSWDKKPEELNFVVETRVHRLNKEQGLIQFHWIELDDDYLTISQNGSEVKALIKGLSPSGRYTIRVISKNKNNEFHQS